jgi:hypothetical protein
VNDRAVLLGTPAIAAGVFAAAGVAIVAPTKIEPSTVGGIMALIGWAAGHAVLQGLVNPGAWQSRRYEMAARQPVNTTINLPHDDGYTSRISSDIPLAYWQAVAKAVVDRRAKNLTQNIIRKALPNLVQDDHRDIHAQMVGLLSAPLVGVIVVKNNHNEITHPVGWSFFARVGNGMNAPLYQYNLHHSPRKADVPPSGAFLSTRAPAARDLGSGWVQL